MNPQYQDKTGKVVDLSTYGDVGAQNTQANKLGLDMVPTAPAPTAGTTITPASLAQTTPINFQNAPVDTPTVEPGIPTPTTEAYTPTAQETEQSSILTRARELLAGTAGESAYRVGQETAQGLAEKQKVLTELSARSQQLQTEAEAIPLQAQAGAEGRGITAGGLAPIQAASVRENTIKQLGVKAAYAVAQGNYAVAQDAIDRAVNAEFGPKKAELDILLKNLELIKADPATSLADKKRADIATAKAEADKATLAQAEADKKTIFSVMTEAVKNGADALTQRNIQNAKTPEEALGYASPFLKTATTDVVKLDNGNTVVIDKRTGAIVRNLGGAKGVDGVGVSVAGAIENVQPQGTGTFSKEDLVNNVKDLKLTEGQANAFSFSVRLIEANKAINKMIADGYDPTTIVSGLGRAVSSDKAREFNRQIENFARAQLRKESGATITDEEISGARALFDPSGFGRDEKDIKATEDTRLQAIQSMVGQAGPAGTYVNQYLHSEGTGQANSLKADDIAEIQSIAGIVSPDTKFNPSSFFK